MQDPLASPHLCFAVLGTVLMKRNLADTAPDKVEGAHTKARMPSPPRGMRSNSGTASKRPYSRGADKNRVFDHDMWVLTILRDLACITRSQCNDLSAYAAFETDILCDKKSRKALRVIPRGKHRLTVYRAHQVDFKHACQKVGKIDHKNEDISESVNPIDSGAIFLSRWLVEPF